MPRYSQERKAAVLKKLLPPENRSVASVATDEGIADATLYGWLKTCRQQGVPVPSKRKTGDNWLADAKPAVVIETASLSEAEMGAYCREKGLYPEQAHAFSDDRRRTAWKWTKRLPSMITAVVDRVREEWSPEQISGFMAPLAGVGVSHQWIYSLIRDDKACGGDLWRHLRQPKRCSRHRAQAKSAGLGKIPNRVGIEHRPADIDGRLTIGHWEGDTVLKGHKQSGLVTLVERRSGYLLSARLPKISAKLTKVAMIRLLKPRRGAVQTITLDNSSEFADHVAVAKAVTAATYFCDPYCSGQRDTNGLIRQYFPKGTDFRRVTDTELRKVVRRLNDRPRKRLGYRTPAQVFLGKYSGALDTAGAALIG